MLKEFMIGIEMNGTLFSPIVGKLIEIYVSATLTLFIKNFFYKFIN